MLGWKPLEANVLGTVPYRTHPAPQILEYVVESCTFSHSKNKKILLLLCHPARLLALFSTNKL